VQGIDGVLMLCDNSYMSIDTLEEVRQDFDRLWSQLMLLVRRLKREATTDGSTWAQLQLLSAIERLGPDASPGSLARDLELQSSNTAAALRDAEGRGYIERVRDATDGRRVHLKLSTPGRAALIEARATRADWLARALHKNFTAEERMLLQRAGVLLERLAKVTDSEV
jgi:DNA-binding MarR family transcriptional regulator